MVMLPIGATEQHGPHLPTGTDTAIAESLCAYASAKAGVLMLPPVPITVSVGHTTKWDGTVSVMHETLMLYLRETVAWLVAKGWDRVLFVNSHFGNNATLLCAVDRLRTDYLGKLQIGVVNTYAVSDDVWAQFIQDADDLHANRAETDLMLFIDPKSVDTNALPGADDPDRTTNGGTGLVFSYPVSQTSTHGVTGMPSTASAERGEKLFIQMGDALTAKLEQGKTELPPLP